jgi:hypothetical protein
MIGALRFPIGVFFQKPLKSGRRDCRRGSPSRLPLLQSGEFRGHASGGKSSDRLSLAQTVRLPPRLETKNDGGGGPAGNGCFVSIRKESFKCRSSDRLGRGLPYFPSLERAEFYWQTGSNQYLDSFRLTEFVQGSPGFQFDDYGQDAAVAGHQDSIMTAAQNTGNSQSQIFFSNRRLGQCITKSVIDCSSYQVRRAQRSTGKNKHNSL